MRKVFAKLEIAPFYFNPVFAPNHTNIKRKYLRKKYIFFKVHFQKRGANILVSCYITNMLANDFWAIFVRFWWSVIYSTCLE